MKRRDRRSDSGSIVVIAAFMLTIMFAMAALAIDVGFFYARSRLLYAVADSAVAVGMKDLMAGATNATITGDVNDVAAQYGGAYTITAAPSASQVQVTVSATYPFFFARAIGFTSKTMTVVAVGKRGTSPPPVLALGGCGAGGIIFNGSGTLDITGDVDSAGNLTFSTGSPGPSITGNANAGCTPTPATNPNATIGGSYGVGPSPPDPFAPYTIPTCDYGSTTTAYSIPGSGPPWDTTTTPPTLAPGVYCSSGNLLLTGPGTGFTAAGVTLISVGGTINIAAGNTASIITPNSKSPNGIVAYSTANTGCSPGAIFVGGPALVPMTIGGALYAPSGCVNVQQNGTFNTDALVGQSVYLGVGSSNPWKIDPGATGGANSWQMSQ